MYKNIHYLFSDKLILENFWFLRDKFCSFKNFPIVVSVLFLQKENKHPVDRARVPTARGEFQGESHERVSRVALRPLSPLPAPSSFLPYRLPLYARTSPMLGYNPPAHLRNRGRQSLITQRVRACSSGWRRGTTMGPDFSPLVPLLLHLSLFSLRLPGLARALLNPLPSLSVLHSVKLRSQRASARNS